MWKYRVYTNIYGIVEFDFEGLYSGLVIRGKAGRR
jgi:hypothetical protein